MTRHTVITFLEGEKGLNKVDPDFKNLVIILHKIPFCASFGVSCSGHLEERGDSFLPKPWGYLNIIVSSDKYHIQKLLRAIRSMADLYFDAAFQIVKHPFGPPEESELRVWEIRINDNGCMRDLVFGENYFGGSLPKEGNEDVYSASKLRYNEIVLFWQALAVQVALFCKIERFENFDPDERVREIMGVWKSEG